MEFLRKYATATHIYIPMIKRGVVDFAVGADWTPANGDVKVSIDGVVSGNIGTLPVAIVSGNGAYWDFVFTAGETTGKKITVTIVDAATKAVEDNQFDLLTYGHASAEIVQDLSAATYQADVAKLLGTAWLTPAVAGTPDVNTKTLATGAIVAGSFTAGAIDAAAIAAGAIGASEIASDAIGAAELAADAVTEIIAGIPAAGGNYATHTNT